MAGSEASERGAIYTKKPVVEFMLDLAGYRADNDLISMSILEPSFGGGDFLIPIVERLLDCWSNRKDDYAVSELSSCIRAVEVHAETFEATRSKLFQLLRKRGVSTNAAEAILSDWLLFGDFLLVPMEIQFDVVIGNPPYLRQESIPDVLVREYRKRYKTIYDRADLYVPFYERGLQFLSVGGRLCFICADRWMKNKYGAPLRKLVSTDYHLRTYIDMVGTNAFREDVVAYPAITEIVRSDSRSDTMVARRPEITTKSLSAIWRSIDNGTVSERIPVPQPGSEPWVLSGSPKIKLIRRIEDKFSKLEEVGCKVGIGVATGSDKAFIAPYDELDVEKSRKLPIALTKDIKSGTVRWQGMGVINPFAADGKLVDLSQFPRLQKYLEANRDAIAGRHVAKKSPAKWYRTIDRIYPELATTPKLLIPDIKGTAQVVFENGNLYPHHNLYFVVSDEWNLRALQAVLMSSITHLFVATYSTRMRGGYLRFQAQYLRRLRLPKWSHVDSALQTRLSVAGESLDASACDQAVFDLYDLTDAERGLFEEVQTRNAA